MSCVLWVSCFSPFDGCGRLVMWLLVSCVIVVGMSLS